MDRTGQFLLHELTQFDHACSSESAQVNGCAPPSNSTVVNELRAIFANVSLSISSDEYMPTARIEDRAALGKASDDVTGKGLKASEVLKTRQDEVAYIHKPNLPTKVPRAKAKSFNKKVITVRWIDISKCDELMPNYRSRLVAREIKLDKRDDLFAATPPLEAMKHILSSVATGTRGEKIMTIDVSRAFFRAPVGRQVFVELPAEDCAEGGDMVGELNYSMYGTRGAAQNWSEECAQTMINIGFTRGKASPCTFYHKDRSLRTYIHGDDFVTAGRDHDLKWLKTQIEKRYEIKTETLGPESQDQQQVKILNRIVTWTQEGLEYEAGPRHVKLIIQDLGLKATKGVSTPGTKEEGLTKAGHDTPLNDDEAHRYIYIPLVARLNYLAPGRSDTAFSVKELARTMSKPTQGCQDKLKRLAVYLIDHPKLLIKYKWQSVPDTLKMYTDADWAGCKATRESTSGRCIVYGSHCFKSSSKTQALTALSGGESEFYATLKAASEGLGPLAIMQDPGMRARGRLFGDASAALGITNRKGLGRTRHIDTGFVCFQETAASKRLSLDKVLGLVNPAELPTKYLSQETAKGHCERLNLAFKDGRADKAFKLNAFLKSVYDYDECEEDTADQLNHESLMVEIEQKVSQVWNRKCKSHMNHFYKGDQPRKINPQVQALKLKNSKPCSECGLNVDGICMFCS